MSGPGLRTGFLKGCIVDLLLRYVCVQDHSLAFQYGVEGSGTEPAPEVPQRNAPDVGDRPHDKRHRVTSLHQPKEIFSHLLVLASWAVCAFQVPCVAVGFDAGFPDYFQKVRSQHEDHKQMKYLQTTQNILISSVYVEGERKVSRSSIEEPARRTCYLTPMSQPASVGLPNPSSSLNSSKSCARGRSILFSSGWHPTREDKRSLNKSFR